MPVPSQTRDRVRTLLPPGERLRYLFPALVTSTAMVSAHVFVAVTDAAIRVIYSGYLIARPRSQLAAYPRTTRMGPVDTGTVPSIRLGRMVLEIDDEYIAVVHAADAELSADALPPDPLPDL